MSNRRAPPGRHNGFKNAVPEKKLRSSQLLEKGPGLPLSEEVYMEARHSFNDSFVQAVINSLNANIAVLDGNGAIVYVNKAWENFAREHGVPQLKKTGRGVNYLAVCQQAAPDDDLAREAARAIEAVLGGASSGLTLEYPCHSANERRWFLMAVTPLYAEGAKVVVAHNDITERKLAEEALSRSHDELDRLVQEKTQQLHQTNNKLLLEIEERKRAEAELRTALDRIEELRQRLEKDNLYLREEVQLKYRFDEIIGQSAVLKYLLYKIQQVAPTDTTVIILGETGTGKELVARAIHNTSLRKDRPLVKVNCAALPANLIESELFGHERGAFTGAQMKRVGRFELADRGTLFLDEVGDLPLELQAKLLRVLQDGTFERLGSSQTIKVDARVIAATSRNLEEAVKQETFREDLWYRLNVFPITVPPLRDRKEDIPLLTSAFLERFVKKMGKQIKEIPQSAIKELQEYGWPGNVRELENIIERAVILSSDKVLSIDLPVLDNTPTRRDRTLKEIEREYVLRTLEDKHWKIEGKNGAADTLGLNPGTLRSRMKKLGIVKPSL